MKYLAIAVLLAILVGAAFYTVQHRDNLPAARIKLWMDAAITNREAQTPRRSTGWTRTPVPS
jgi:hypothetical protein